MIAELVAANFTGGREVVHPLPFLCEEEAATTGEINGVNHAVEKQLFPRQKNSSALGPSAQTGLECSLSHTYCGGGILADEVATAAGLSPSARGKYRGGRRLGPREGLHRDRAWVPTAKEGADGREVGGWSRAACLGCGI